MIISNTKPVYALVRCTEIIVVCKVRGVQSNGEDCCKNVFDRKPIFTAKGVCFNSQNLQDAQFPSDLDAVHIWLAPTKVDIEYSSTIVLIHTIFKRQNFWMILIADLLGDYTSTGLFEGIFYTLTDKSEHPIFKLLEEPKIVQSNQHHWLRLETNVVTKKITTCCYGFIHHKICNSSG